ncbi:hypothetical protein HZA73_03790 [candidate division TA06 bacterium]|nr:hypothetical protein [candidate division TA06 bacterium]
MKQPDGEHSLFPAGAEYMVCPRRQSFASSQFWPCQVRHHLHQREIS